MYLEVNYTLLHTFNVSLKVTSNSKAIYVCTCIHFHFVEDQLGHIALFLRIPEPAKQAREGCTQCGAGK